jgi:flavorubredoxin
MITNKESGTRIDEIADGIYRISTPVSVIPGGFTFNQFLIKDEEPLLFHTGLRRMFPVVAEAVKSVLKLESLRWIGFSHFEADECGALNDFLGAAPHAEPVCGSIAKMVSADDVADRPARGLADGEELRLGRSTLSWLDAPHLPHGWDCGFLFESASKTLFCGDLFTQGGADHEPLTESDILGPSEEMRQHLDYYAHAENTRELLEKLAATAPTTLACMHGASFKGDGASLLRALADELSKK